MPGTRTERAVLLDTAVCLSGPQPAAEDLPNYLRRATHTYPAELQALPCWGVWKSVPDRRTGKLLKIPFRSSDGKPASTTKRDDWGTFEAAIARYRTGDYSGLGFAFFPEYNVVGIDRDKCRNPKTGVIESWALRELAALPTYAEVSPSGTGYKQFGFGRLPNGAKSTKPGSQSEMYDGAPGRERFFTVTGHRLEGTPDRAQDISGPLIEAHKRMMAFDLAEAFKRRGWLRAMRDGKQLVRCPWADQHTHGDDEAALFKKRGRKGGYNFKCLHGHCATRTATDVYLLFGFDEDQLETDTRPRVLVGGDLHLKTQEIFDVLVDLNVAAPDPIIYLFGNSFGRISHMTVDERPAVDLLTPDKLKELLAAHIRFQSLDNGVFSATAPPQIVITNMLAVGEPPRFPRIRRLVSAPVFAADGTLLTQPGFHAGARVYYAPDPGFVLRPVPAHPSDDNIAEARRLLEEELLGDFRFIDEKADRAHAIALLLLFFARDLIDGNLPLHLIEKPEVGTGAGKLADVCMIPALGGRQSVITDCDDEDEWRKRITATLMEAPEAVLLDNVVKISSHQLAALFTTKKWKDRVLGHSRIVDLPADMPWVATGNNPEIGYDLVRRICAIRLDAKMPDPTTRTGFKHELPAWAIAERAVLVWAALTLIQHWVVTGQKLSSRRIASFEEWSAVMGGILEAVGIEGFGTNASMFRQARNVRGNAWGALVEAWWLEHKSGNVGTADLWAHVINLDIEGDLGLHDGKIRDARVAFGLALRRQRGRQFRLDNKTEVRIEIPEGATVRRPYCLFKIGENGEMVVVPKDPEPRIPGTTVGM